MGADSISFEHAGSGVLKASSLEVFAGILRLAAISLAVLFSLDALTFRTPWYSDYIEPQSFAGSYEDALWNELTRPLHGKQHILVFGDSSIAEGFSAMLANRTDGCAGCFFSSVGTPAATPRAWFYLLRDLDPDAKRYNVIVLPVTDYADADGMEAPANDIEADRDMDLNRLIVRLRLSDLFSFPFSYRDPAKKVWAFEGTAFKGSVYSQDVQAFLDDPAARIRKVELFDRGSRQWIDDYAGREGSLEGLSYDYARRVFTFPSSMTAAERKALADRFHPERMHLEGYRRAYREMWLGAIINHYKATGARIVIFRMPFRPLPLHASVPTNGASFVQQASRNPRVTVLDENLFGDMERPDLFFDAYHLNRRGRLEFTGRLARAIGGAVSGQVH